MEIIDYPNYLIYRDGRVFNNKYKRFLKPGNQGLGYLHVVLYNNGHSKDFLIHRLVAEHYIKNPENKATVDHLNRNKLDNRVENLKWANRKEQSINQSIPKNNTSGHKYITYTKSQKKWAFLKQGQNRIIKPFNTKIEAICYKYIYLLKIKTFNK
jgi:hypothetical protein